MHLQEQMIWLRSFRPASSRNLVLPRYGATAGITATQSPYSPGNGNMDGTLLHQTPTVAQTGQEIANIRRTMVQLCPGDKPVAVHVWEAEYQCMGLQSRKSLCVLVHHEHTFEEEYPDRELCAFAVPAYGIIAKKTRAGR